LARRLPRPCRSCAHCDRPVRAARRASVLI
jgi:hypothetical protein